MAAIGTHPSLAGERELAIEGGVFSADVQQHTGAGAKSGFRRARLVAALREQRRLRIAHDTHYRNVRRQNTTDIRRANDHL